MKLESARVLVTGGSGAIGAAVCRRLGAAGAMVAVHYLQNEEGANQVVQEIEGMGGTALSLVGDLADRDAAEQVVSATVSELGGLDGLVCMAGATVGGGPFDELSADDWRAAMDANLMTAVNAAQAAQPHLEQTGGRIVFTSSVRGLGLAGREGIMAYSAAKAALINLTTTLAKDLGPEILVNAVAPGFVWTKNYEAMPEQLRKGFTDSTVLGRFIEPDEIADCYEFLLTTEIVTGQILVADGGFTLKLA